VTGQTETWTSDRTRHRLVREASRYVGAAEAEDATQEALIRAWRFQDACDDPSNPLPWLLQIARREALRLRDRPSRRENVVEPALLTELLDTQDTDNSPSLPIPLEQGLGCLSDNERNLLAMRYELDLTHATIAEQLGISEGAVRVRLHRAMKGLRRHVEQRNG
jgi:RNA polymerase sigma-70 factor (ECF subfamily)